MRLSIVRVGIAIGRGRAAGDGSGDCCSVAESSAKFVLGEVDRLVSWFVEFRLMASGALLLSLAGIGSGTDGNALRIDSPPRVAESSVSGTLSEDSLRSKEGLVSGNSAMRGWTMGGSGGGPGGGGKGGGNSASAAFCLPLLENHKARLSLGLPDAVELLRCLSPNPFSEGASS